MIQTFFMIAMTVVPQAGPLGFVFWADRGPGAFRPSGEGPRRLLVPFGRSKGTRGLGDAIPRSYNKANVCHRLCSTVALSCGTGVRFVGTFDGTESTQRSPGGSESPSRPKSRLAAVGLETHLRVQPAPNGSSSAGGLVTRCNSVSSPVKIGLQDVLSLLFPLSP